MRERGPEWQRFDSLRSLAGLGRLALAEALAYVDRKLDWQPEDSAADQAIPSRVYVDHTERPYLTEEELTGQLPLWEGTWPKEN